MYLGRIVETASAKDLFDNPLHPYTVGLLRSVPKLVKKLGQTLDAIEGTVPTPLGLPWQCGFFPRCPKAIKGVCDCEMPALVEHEPGHCVRCFLYSDEKEPLMNG